MSHRSHLFIRQASLFAKIAVQLADYAAAQTALNELRDAKEHLETGWKA